MVILCTEIDESTLHGGKCGRGLVQEDINNVTKLLENQPRRRCDDLYSCISNRNKGDILQFSIWATYARLMMLYILCIGYPNLLMSTQKKIPQK